MQDLRITTHPPRHVQALFTALYTTCIHVYTHSTGTHICIVYFTNLVNYHTLLVNVYH